MTRSEIIELSSQLTERKGEKVLNLPTLFKFVCQDICKRQRFWWRRVLQNFSLTAGTTTYDLTNTTLFPNFSELALEEVTKFSVVTLAASGTNPATFVELTPIFDPEAVLEMVYNQTNGVQTAPSRYTFNPGDFKTLLIDPPDLAYSCFIVGWAMPNPATDTTTDTVPLIPPWAHNAIVLGMVAKIFRFAYGSRNEKTNDAVGEYEQAIQDLQMKQQFDPNYRRTLSLQEDAVRST